MMEFFLSKVWTFIVALAVMAVLMQGVQTVVSSESSGSMDAAAESIQDMLAEMEAAGPGLERMVCMDELLPDGASFTLTSGIGTLTLGDVRRSFKAPMATYYNGRPMIGEVPTDTMTVSGDDTLMVVYSEDGMVIRAISPRTSPLRT